MQVGESDAGAVLAAEEEHAVRRARKHRQVGDRGRVLGARGRSHAGRVGRDVLPHGRRAGAAADAQHEEVVELLARAGLATKEVGIALLGEDERGAAPRDRLRAAGRLRGPHVCLHVEPPQVVERVERRERPPKYQM